MRQLLAEFGVSKFINLAANENPWGPSPTVLEAILSAANRVNRYPQGWSTDLREAIAELEQVEANQVFIGNGSDECIRMIAECFLDKPSDEILVADPTFVCYADAATNRNCRVAKAQLDKDGRIDLTQISCQVSADTKIIYLSNPNNPTGTFFTSEELSDFLELVDRSTVIVLDEAYFEYAACEPAYPNGVDFVNKYPNVVVLRTFSKAYGLAGLRCGYGIAADEFVQILDRIRMPFNVNSMAQAASLAAIRDQSHVTRIVGETIKGRARIIAMLTSAGAQVFDSAANFVYAEFESESAPFVHNLMKQGILVRGCAVFGSPNGVRISVGTESELDQLEAAMANLPQEQYSL
jgi:histidinol-phosphate aminotransferase